MSSVVPRPRPPQSHHTHESLMGSMMARSTPRVLFHSPVVRHIITFLEFVAACYALALCITLCCLHIRFVRHQGCASLLQPAETIFRPHSHPHTTTTTTTTAAAVATAAAVSRLSAPILELAVVLPDHHCPHAPCLRHRFRFSQERGLLLLSDRTLTSLNLSVATVPLPSDHVCLGDPVSRFILLNFIGYDTVVVNAFASMRRRIRSPDGYVLTLQSRRVLNLLHADPTLTALSTLHPLSRLILHLMRKCGAVITAVFIMCTTAALVAFTLREIQVRMIKLTIDLHLIMRSQRGYAQVIIRYATDALVFVPIIAGMLFFLFEFFDDQALAFAVLVITWLCEFAASGSTRHWVSRLYLPRLFFFYFVAFHIYFFSFPLGFSWLSFATSLALMVHAALAVWNHCEIPLLRNQNSWQSHWT